MEHGGHPPGEALHLPYAAEAGLGVGVEQVAAAGGVEVRKGAGEDAHVGDSEIESFGTGGRHDVRGVSGEEELAVLHRFDYETSHASDAFLEHRAFLQLPIFVGREAEMKFLPDFF